MLVKHYVGLLDEAFSRLLTRCLHLNKNEIEIGLKEVAVISFEGCQPWIQTKCDNIEIVNNYPLGINVYKELLRELKL